MNDKIANDLSFNYIKQLIDYFKKEYDLFLKVQIDNNRSNKYYLISYADIGLSAIAEGYILNDKQYQDLIKIIKNNIVYKVFNYGMINLIFECEEFYAKELQNKIKKMGAKK